ncbi:sigma 54-interacting transcriptional regulator [Anaerosinus massiliensis]|uniref:sigma 54-interacting transcriptional regulator n=1 Tax=Massilibacillus massiliensis TaxID=1806837 RepID=UPI0018FE1E78|nr:sigma 54-interacting transcriptional regulator [Massilibacillus massiliensis]
MMRKQIQKLIAEEDYNHPYTDTELCKKLSVSREYVTLLRKELKILDSRERKQVYICEEIKQMLLSKASLSNQEIRDQLQQKGYSISTYLLQKYITDMESQRFCNDLVPALSEEEVDREEKEKSYHSFENLVGARGSLDTQIQQAKATMLYPPHGLHCLIVGETGVGKSELAEAMYHFALEAECLPKQAPFNVFNCADYAENSQLLITQLFGCVKGAYTGAVTDRKGLIEQTDGGILFLDEVHRLSSEGQEMLFQLIDKGHFRRLGETDAVRQAKVQLIAATTENIETSLLTTFKRRIPMLINIPPLEDRPLTERLQLIQRFFSYESTRMNAKLQVSIDVIKAYLLYECKGNIGQLKSDIQVTCAKSFLSYVTKKEKVVKVDLQSLSLYVKKGLLKIQSKRHELEAIVWKDFYIEPNQWQDPIALEDDAYSFPKEFYGYIESVHTEYMQQGMDEKQIRRLIGEEIEQKLQHVISHIKRRLAPLTLEEVSKVIGSEVIYLAQDILKIAEAELGKLDESLVYCLAIHLNATFTRLSQGKKIINPNLEDVKRKFRLEYQVAEKMVDLIKVRYKIELPEDEISYIALYLHGNEQEEEGNVGVVVATHGNVGSNMLEIANKLLNVTHGKSFNMSFEESPRDALDRLTEVIKSADEGKGVLMLVDLGSLLTFGEIIQTRTKIKVETVDRVDTVMVIEALRRSILPGSNLTDMVSGIESLNYLFPKTRPQAPVVLRKKAIITICFTGEGVALYCAGHIKKIFGDRLQGITFLNVGIIGRHDIYKQIQQILMQYDVIMIIGSVDPQLQGIPYISVHELSTKQGNERLAYLLNEAAASPAFLEKKTTLVPEVVQKAKVMMLGKEKYTKSQILEKMCKILADENYVRNGYGKAVLEREKMGVYLINQKVALPHADSSYVKESVVFIAKAETPIVWAGKTTTRLICLLALDIHGKDGIRYLYERFQNDEVIALMEAATTEQELREALVYNAN